MEKIIPIVYYVYAVLLIGGGAMGSKVSGKPSSIVGSLIFGAVVVVAGVLTKHHPRVGMILGIVDALAVTGFFIYRYSHTHKAMPAFPAIAMSLVVVVLTAITFASAGKNATP